MLQGEGRRHDDESKRKPYSAFLHYCKSSIAGLEMYIYRTFLYALSIFTLYPEDNDRAQLPKAIGLLDFKRAERNKETPPKHSIHAPCESFLNNMRQSGSAVQATVSGGYKGRNTI